MRRKIIQIIGLLILLICMASLVSCNNNEIIDDPPVEDVTITFITNNQLEIEPMTGKAGDSLVLPQPETRGYVFNGWHTNNSYDTLFGRDTYPSHDINLYARWTISQYTLTYDTCDGDEIQPEQYYYNNSVSFRTPLREGYTFDNWYYDMDYQEEVDVSTFRMPDSNLTIYAKWLENSIISFETNGGIEIESIEDYKGANIQAPNIPVYQGNYFIGWYTDSNFIGEPYEFSVMPNENITLYAKWGIKQIADKNDLLLINSQPYGGYELINDINLGNESWNPIATFNGVLNGNNHKIYNFNIENKQRAGLIGTNSGEINNLEVSNYTITIDNEYDSSLYIGALVAYNTGSITNCKSYGDISLDTNTLTYLGGLIGYSLRGLDIEDCEYDGDIQYSNNDNLTHIGGILGFGMESGNIINCQSSGLIENNNSPNNSVNLGGIIGYIQGRSNSIEDSFSDMSIDIMGNYYNNVGGIIGRAITNTSLIVEGCYYNGNIAVNSGFSKVGGIIGHNDRAAIRKCFTEAFISIRAVSKLVYAGGIAGHHIDSSIYNSYSSSSITIETCTNSYIGGIAGASEGEYVYIEKSYNEGEISLKKALGNTNYFGGVVGYSEGQVKECYSVVDLIAGHTGIINDVGISGKLYLGGIVGRVITETTILSCYNIGNINVIAKNETYIGGIIGNIDRKQQTSFVADCYYIGDILLENSGSSYVGGCFGQVDYENYDSSPAIISCYSSSNIVVTGSTIYAGGVIGRLLQGKVIKCFALGNVTASGSGDVFTSGVVASPINIDDSYFASDCIITGGEVIASPPYPVSREELLDEEYMEWDLSLWDFDEELPSLIYNWDTDIWDNDILTEKGNPTLKGIIV